MLRRPTIFYRRSSYFVELNGAAGVQVKKVTSRPLFMLNLVFSNEMSIKYMNFRSVVGQPSATERQNLAFCFIVLKAILVSNRVSLRGQGSKDFGP